MNKFRQTFKISGLLFFSIIVSCTERQKEKKDSVIKKPNIVFILTDDQRYDAYSAAGHPFLKTPNIDRLANEGATFANAFVTTSICAPSRGSILTGMYAHSSGVPTIESLKDPNPKWPTFSQLLQKAGYETAFLGKWHMARHKRPRRGFDHWVSFYNQGNYFGNELNVDGHLVWEGGYITDVLTEYALDFLKKMDNEKPFMLYLSHKAVHSPFTPADRHKTLFDTVEVISKHNPNDILQNKQKWRKERERSENPQINQNAIKNYNRAITAVDDGLGKILKLLEKKKVLDNTLIVFSSDNGYFQGEHGGMSDKRHAYEPSIRVPMLMRFPKIFDQKSIYEEMVLNIDLMPTFLEMAGVAIPETVQGQSIIPIAKRKQKGRASFLYEYFQEDYDYSERPTVLAVRTNDYKLITYPEVQGAINELYNLREDPEELFNLYEIREYSEVRDSLERKIEELKSETDFKMNPPTPRENLEMIQMWQSKKGYNVKSNAIELHDSIVRGNKN